MRSAAGYSVVTRDSSGAARVELESNHPGVADPEYRARRDAIAALAVGWSPGRPVPEVDYSAAEHATWATVCERLAPLWQSAAATTFRRAVAVMDLPTGRVPQLGEITERLTALSGFAYQPVAGLAPLREFYTAFGGGVFWSTQYLRHHSRPLYTPEPDLCHEVLGHAHQLADPGFAALYRAVAAAAARVETAGALSFLSRVFWHTVEFGVVEEDGEIKAYGAGLLSSFGEMQEYRRAVIRPVDWAVMGTRTYDITRYQTELFCAPSIGWLVDEFGSWLDAFDDSTAAELAQTAAT